MNRFKKELRKNGVRLENDFPWLPYTNGVDTLIGITVDSENCMVTKHYSTISYTIYYNRQMKGIMVLWNTI